MSSTNSASAVLTRWALRRPVTVCMLFFSMLVLGMLATRLLPLEKFPGVDIPQIMIQVPYPDASPAEVERLITRPLEEALAGMSGIVEMRSFSRENGTDIVLDFRWDENINARNIEVREQIDSVRHLLPADVERVFVFQFSTDDMPVFQLRISSEIDLQYAWDLLERTLKRPMERVAGVSRVELYGVDKRDIVIRLRRDEMAALNVDPALLRQRLQQANFTLTAGYLDDGQQRILVNPVGQFESLDDIRALQLTPQLRLSDVADVDYELPRRRDGRHFNQSYAIGMNVYKESTANLVDVSARALEVVEAARQHPEFANIDLMLMDDTAASVKSSLNDLLWAGLLGALLSIIVLYAYLRHAITTLIVVVSVPVAIFLTLAAMYLLGYSLNILSMMGLMLAVGMLVDNAVVVTESIQQEGDAERGISKVALAVIAGTLTTAIVFLPTVFGAKIEITVLLEHVAVAICISLLASLLVSQTLIPLLISRLPSRLMQEKPRKARVKAFYLSTLRWSQRHPRVTSLAMLLVLLASLFPFSQTSSDQADVAYNDRLILNYHLNGQYRLDEIRQEVARMEAYLYENKEAFEIDHVYSYFATSHAFSMLLLNPERSQSVAEIQNRVRENWPLLVRSEPQFGWQSSNQGVRVTLTGASTSTLQTLADELIPLLAAIEGLTDVRSEAESTQQELQIRLQASQLHRLGLTSQEVAAILSTALRGDQLRSFRHDPSGELRIRLTYDRELETSLSAIRELVVHQYQGQPITLQQVADIELQPRLTDIRRVNRETAVRIGANLNEMTMQEASVALTEVLEQVHLPDGYRWSLDGGFRNFEETSSVMQVNMLLALCLIYLVMAALFESLLLPNAVIGSLLLAMAGVFWGLWITSTSLDMMVMIGMLILMGVVVNNGIVLVDRINQLYPELALEDAIIAAADQRVRPIMMTVSTTVLGLLPLALGTTQIGGDGPPYAPMAIAIISGLLFSTFTSLYFVPHAYHRLLVWRAHWINVVRYSASPMRARASAKG
ncbi:efflux RND transporter permease subunit [Aliidiomarina soli]|uniref:AcrB/AcrD/AcrF family protein n=1 Tax=Aliidiomarina soli TaxID=1928574 RepID=A0A432WHF3_9GAMM|nr:efflux RND transporter permease subunit [Aliidiomarina soli]RUO33230.1 AcrB/AcrD/AcrF family protein [Aliidiomarina soli]